MRAVDEPITLKEKACRPVCRRREGVMIEREKPVVCRDASHARGQEIRDKILKANRLGLSWTDKGSKSSLLLSGDSKTRIPG